MIPKKIHYCWFGPKPFPKLVKECLATWKEHFPDYEFYLWNETNSPMDVAFVKEAYSAKKYAFVSDYVRFWALYNEGGVYLDTDMFVIRSMDKLLDNYCFFAYEFPDNSIIGCCVIGCEGKNKFISQILDTYHNTHFRLDNITKLVIPRLITPIYEKFSDKNNILIFSYDYFYPFPYEERAKVMLFRKYATNNTYAIHLWNLSWVSSFDKLSSKAVKFFKRYIK